MVIPSRGELDELLKAARISRRLVRDLRYVPEAIGQLDERDFLVVTTKSGNEGVLLYDGTIAPFELQRRGPNASGRVEAVICDICATWQRGTNSAVLTLRRSDKHSSSHLVCADLDCSLHVRGLTTASKLARAQVREHISPEGRIERLHERLGRLLEPTDA